MNLNPAPDILLEKDCPGGAADRPACFHCGEMCRNGVHVSHEKAFCCAGCLAVFELLTENGLDQFYSFEPAAGVKIRTATEAAAFQYLDDPRVRERIVDYADDRVTRILLRIPAIHCIACVWLLENLFRLKAGIGSCRVNFPRKELSLAFATSDVKLSEVITLLASLGYEPELKLADIAAAKAKPASRRLWLQLGVAGFAFGNIMLFSISSYLGLDRFSGPGLKVLFAYISFGLSLPVVFYSAGDYWRAAWSSVRERWLTVEVPIALGIAALFGKSVCDVLSGRGEGYFDSLAGLVFFLLCGKWFQQKTFERLAFDRDYKSFFPLSIIRKRGRMEERVALSQLEVGDHLIVRNGELVPADARLVEGPALIDYSFVTGESAPVQKRAGDYLYAGGRQIGGAIEVQCAKAVSHSYLASLWDQETFRKTGGTTFQNMTDRFSRSFTRIVLAAAASAAAYWWWHDRSRSLPAFASVLIVACPCALALAAPFALGTAQRLLARRGIFLKNPSILERLAEADTIVFDKTGTLSTPGAESVRFHGAPLGEAEERWLYSMTRHSTHPYPVRIGQAIAGHHFPDPVRSFLETPGCGLEGSVAGHEIWMGSAAWLASRTVATSSLPETDGSRVHVAIDGRHRGTFALDNGVRAEVAALLQRLSARYALALLSGDNEQERARFAPLFGASAQLHFQQTPLDKLQFIRGRQKEGRKVIMVGDGLNDAGALKQSDVGIAVMESISAFSPASDVVMAAAALPRLNETLRLARATVRIVKASFVISSLYNVIGITIAARGLLSPAVCAILMPLSSITVVSFACLATCWAAGAAWGGRGPGREAAL